MVSPFQPLPDDGGEAQPSSQALGEAGPDPMGEGDFGKDAGDAGVGTPEPLLGLAADDGGFAFDGFGSADT